MDSFVRSLSDNPNRPCFFLQYGETFILLDCALDLRPVLRFLPVSQVFTPAFAQIKRWNHNNPFLYSTDSDILENEGNLLLNGALEFQVPDFQLINPGDLHYILISNFSQVFALPYLINERNFHGRIFATEPTVQYARDVFKIDACGYRIPADEARLDQDMSSYLTIYGSPVRAEKWKVKEVKQLLPAVLQMTKPHLWHSLCSIEALELALKKLEPVNFRQTIALENSLTITAVSSGFCIGACNWVIESPKEKIVYLSDTSTLTTHVLPMDKEPLNDATVMIASSLNMDPQRSPEDSLKMMGQAIKDSIREGGNVLVPFSSPDLLIDMLEYVLLYMDDLPVSVPVSVLSASAGSVLSLSQVYSEWLSDEYRNRAYLPEEPFIHGEMIRSGRIKVFPSVDGKFSETFKSPCIVFCSHYSLRFGPAVHLLAQWKGTTKNGIVFTDPEFHPSEALAPYMPVSLKVAYCPLDTRLKPSQLTKIIDTAQPKMLVIHERYLSSWDGSPDSADFTVRCPKDVTVASYKDSQDTALPLPFRWLETVAETSLLSDVRVLPFKPSGIYTGSEITVGRLCGGLKSVDNKYMMDDSAVKGFAGSKRDFVNLSLVKPDVARLVRLLKKDGFRDVSLVINPATGSDRVVCGEVGVEILVSEHSTEVTLRKPSREIRSKIRDLIYSFQAGKKEPSKLELPPLDDLDLSDLKVETDRMETDDPAVKT